jgi:hypothetical protein
MLFLKIRKAVNPSQISKRGHVFHDVRFLLVIPRRLQLKFQRFGTLCLFHLHRRVGMKRECGCECWVLYVKKCGSKNSLSPTTAVTIHTYWPLKMQHTEFRNFGIQPSDARE